MNRYKFKVTLTNGTVDTDYEVYAGCKKKSYNIGSSRSYTRRKGLRVGIG